MEQAYLVKNKINSINNIKSKNLALKDINDMIEYAKISDMDSSKDISIKEALFIRFGLTFSNLGTGLAASITGVSIYFTVITTFQFPPPSIQIYTRKIISL